jgi:hypothetical protein
MSRYKMQVQRVQTLSGDSLTYWKTLLGLGYSYRPTITSQKQAIWLATSVPAFVHESNLP